MNPMDLAQHAGAHPWMFLAAALALGALHGLEPGHSKGIMTAFMIGTRGTYGQAVVLALCATLSHTAVVWILAVPASFGGTWYSDAQIAPYLSLASGIVVLVLAVCISLLAPIFGGRRSFDGAFRLAVYSFTPVWLAGIFLLLPGLYFLVLLGCYGLYILWLGAPRLAKVPGEMSLTFAIVIAAIGAALTYAAATAQHMIFGTPGF